MGWCGLNGKISRIHKAIFGKEPVWEESCHQHDCDYIHGGYYYDPVDGVKRVSRLRSDWDLFMGVASAGWQWWPMAVIYLIVVRFSWGKWDE